MIFKPTKYQDMNVHPKLQELVGMVFSTMPNLEFHASNSKLDANNTKHINEVEVFCGEQRLGKMAWTEKYTRSGYVPSYKIYSPKIRKQRGDTHAKYTTDLKTAIKIAKQHFVKDTDVAQLNAIVDDFKSKYNEIIWYYNKRYEDKTKPLYNNAVSYLINTIEGTEPTIDPALVQIVKSPEFAEARSNYRIAKTVQKQFDKNLGVILYVDRENKLTVADMENQSLTKIESTYDLPKNYQEKYAMLKIMEDNQPIESVGVKISSVLYGVKTSFFYLLPGDPIITH